MSTTLAGLTYYPNASTLVSERAYAILSRAMPVATREHRQAVIAEIGVYAGRLSTLILQQPWTRLLMVDLWKIMPGCDIPQATWDKLREQAIINTSFAADRRQVIRGDSATIGNMCPSGIFDLVFIDGDHSYEGCARDILAWEHAVKPGGYFGGHDYKHAAHPGVTQAVDEYIARAGVTLELGEDFTWWVLL